MRAALIKLIGTIVSLTLVGNVISIVLVIYASLTHADPFGLLGIGWYMIFSVLALPLALVYIILFNKVILPSKTEKIFFTNCILLVLSYLFYAAIGVMGR